MLRDSFTNRLYLKHGPDGLSDITTTHPEWNVQDIASMSKLINESEASAEDAIIDMLLQEPDDSVTVIAVGPCMSPPSSD